MLESQWSKLLKGIQNSKDFEEVRILHETYLSAIIDQCFLNLSVVLKALQDVLAMCNHFYRLFREGFSEEKIMDRGFGKEFMELKGKFET